MMMKKMLTVFSLTAVSFLFAHAQPTQPVTDPEARFKEARELFMQGNYALAYPLLVSLKADFPDQTSGDHAYLNEDINYYYIACRLKMDLAAADKEARQYITSQSNDPRRQMLSFHLAHYLYNHQEWEDVIAYYKIAGITNLDNDQVADAEFERAYAHFNRKEFAEAKPLFAEASQLQGNQYYHAANYYYGYLSFLDRDFAVALPALKTAAEKKEYRNAIPYFMAEIDYFTGKKEEALQYCEAVMNGGADEQNKKAASLLAAQIYFENKQYNKVIPLLENAVRQDENISKTYRYELSCAYYETKQWDKAIAGFRQLAGDKDSLERNSTYLLANSYLRTGRKAEARNAFRSSAIRPANEKEVELSRFQYAKLSYDLGYPDTALQAMRSYVNDYPQSDNGTEAKVILVKLLANVNQFQEALNVYDGLEKPRMELHTVYPRILYGRAMELINDEQYDNAEALLDSVLDQPVSASTPYAQFWKGEIAYRKKDYDAAIRFHSAFLQSNAPALAEAKPVSSKYTLGYSWLYKEDYNKALGFFEQVATKVSPTSSPLEQDAFVRGADCYYMNRNYVKAGQLYDSVINNALIPSDYAYYQKAMIAGIGNMKSKIDLLNKLARLYPNSALIADAQMEVANTYMADEKFSEAIPYLDKLIAGKESDTLVAQAMLKRGLCFYNTSRNAEALDEYQRLINQFPGTAEADEALANARNIYVEDGKPDEYIELLQRNGRSVPSAEADSLTYVSAEAKYTAGDCAASIKGFSNYLSAYPDGPHALEANYYLAECYNKSKDVANAVRYYDAVNAKGPGRYFERSTMEAARLSYFELKDYAAAKKYFIDALTTKLSPENELDALRGLVRCYSELKEYDGAGEAAARLVAKKGISTDDKAVGWLVLGKSQQLTNNCNEAIASFKNVASINKTAWGAEARYEIAHCHYDMNNLKVAEKSGLALIKEVAGNDYWVTKTYILLGDIFLKQKDYFNAKATYESVAKNAVIPELKNEAQQKLEQATEAESNSK